MVEHAAQLDLIFQSLADPTRRDILRFLSRCEATVSEIVVRYNVSFAAISKHLKVLEHAELITKRKEGRTYVVSLSPVTLQEAEQYLEQYRHMWQSRYRKLDVLLKED